MNEKYKSIIYSSNQDMQNTIDQCLQTAADRNNCSKADVQEDIKNNIKSAAVCDYVDALLWSEGTALYTKICQCFASELWKSNACLSNECAKKCPFGDICRKDYVLINDNKFCYGRLTTLCGIKSDKELIELATKQHISICRENGSIIADLNSSYDEQQVESWFGKYEWHIKWFGDSNNASGKAIRGEQAILALLHTNPNE